MANLARDHLAKFGVTIAQATRFIESNLQQPKTIFDTCKEYGVSNEMLAEIAQPLAPGATANLVRNFFQKQNFDSLELDKAYFAKLIKNTTLPPVQATNDTLTLGDGDDYVDAGAGSDVVYGNAGNDVIVGGSGDDQLYGGWGTDSLDGGLGADTLRDDASPVYISGRYEGKTWINGYTQYDTSSNIMNGGGGNDRIYGGYGDDVLDGGDGTDAINGGAGADLIYGGNGDDSIYGDDGNDTIYGGNGNDQISGGAGNKTLYGEMGDDVLSIAFYDGLTDILMGGDGNDTLRFSFGDQANGGAGNDILQLNQYSLDKATVASIASVVAGEGEDSIYAGGLTDLGRAIIDLRETTPAKDTIDTGTISSVTSPAIEVLGFDTKFDKISLERFDLYNAGTTSAVGGGSANYAQIINTPNTPYLTPVAGGKTADSYGKGFFVIQGASVAAADTVNVASFLDNYGNNATYGKSKFHYFLINVGSKDAALYAFKDDTGADNIVTPDEIIPIMQLTGLRTEQFTASDLVTVFV